jgi:hypothetical protein
VWQLLLYLNSLNELCPCGYLDWNQCVDYVGAFSEATKNSSSSYYGHSRSVSSKESERSCVRLGKIHSSLLFAAAVVAGKATESEFSVFTSNIMDISAKNNQGTSCILVRSAGSNDQFVVVLLVQIKLPPNTSF